MRSSPLPLRKSDRTREAILSAARVLFAERGYEATTVRDVAAAAGVDAALVMRYFGPKEDLFARASHFELHLPDLRTVPRASVGEALARRFLALWEGPEASMGLAVLLRSAASNEVSADKVRELFARDVTRALSAVGERRTAGRRAALVASQLLGVALCRYVIGLPPLVAMGADELVAHVAPTLQRYAVVTGRGGARPGRRA